MPNGAPIPTYTPKSTTENREGGEHKNIFFPLPISASSLQARQVVFNMSKRKVPDESGSDDTPTLSAAKMVKVDGKSSRTVSCVSSTDSHSSDSSDEICMDPFNKLDADGLHPTSKWRLEWVEPFCDLQFTDLGFTKDDLQNVELLPEVKVFAECTATMDDIAEGAWELDLNHVQDPGYRRLLDEKIGATFVQLQRVLRHHATTTAPPSENGVDALAMQLLNLCGFNNHKESTFASQPIEFKFAGMQINCEADDVYVAKCNKGSSGALVFIWEDKLSMDKEGNEKTTATMLKSSAAQIIGEMMSAHYRNKSNNLEPCALYAVRLIDDMVTFFRMHMTAEQIEAVCEKGVIPDPKLKV